MRVPGRLVSLLTFPGVIVQQVARQIFSRLARVAVTDVCYFRLGDPAGFVVYEEPRRYSHQILMKLGPFFFSSVLAVALSFSAAIPALKFRSPGANDLLLIWLAMSVAMHAFPRQEEARDLWASITDPDGPLTVRLIGAPIVGLLYLGTRASDFGLNVIWAIFLAAVLPNLLVSALA
jgi:hypothetical protein